MAKALLRALLRGMSAGNACTAETYSYDPASNRLTSVLAGGVTRSFTYSDSGNVTLDNAGGTATTLTCNAADRLVRVSAGGITLVDYVYAATGQRAIKATPSATTHYLYDPGGALQAETDGAGTVLREYITLGGATVAIVDALGINYVHNDHLATPQVMTDGSAAVVWDASYRPFGEAIIAGAAANDQRFPGQTADAETGYHDNWHRTYGPSLGRYLQSDPIGIAAGFNTYGYLGGNPVMLTDRTGECPWCVSAGVGAAFGGGTEAGIQLYQHGRIVSWSRVGYATGAGALGGLLGYGTRGMGLLGFGLVLGGEGLIGAGYACATGEDPLRGALYGVLGAGAGRLVGKVFNPWRKLPIFRGNAIEKGFGGNLGNFPVIDKFRRGIASSIKSIDLGAATYQNASKLRSVLTGYVDKLAAFNGRRWNGTVVGGPNPILGKQLIVAVPQGGNAFQLTVLNEIVAYGSSLGIEVVVKVVR